jgi:hypothetical protein
MATKNRGENISKKRQAGPGKTAVLSGRVEVKNNICANASCRLRKAGCRGFEGCPGYKGK